MKVNFLEFKEKVLETKEEIIRKLDSSNWSLFIKSNIFLYTLFGILLLLKLFWVI